MKEDIIQQQIIGFLSVMARKYNFIFFSPMNEAAMMIMRRMRVPQKTISIMMSWMSKMGFLPGVSDIIIMQAGKVYCLELKNETGRQLKSQILFQTNCKRCGIPYEIARSLKGAQDLMHMWGIID